MTEIVVNPVCGLCRGPIGTMTLSTLIRAIKAQKVLYCPSCGPFMRLTTEAIEKSSPLYMHNPMINHVGE